MAGTPYHIAFIGENLTTLSVWPLPVTTGTSVGDGIIVFIAVPSTTPAITNVTDTQSNSYSLVTSDTSQPQYAYKAAAPIKQLTTSDTININWAATQTAAGCVCIIGTPGCQSVDNFNNSDNASNTGAVTKAPTVDGETSLYAIAWNNTNAGTLSGGNPGYAAVANVSSNGPLTYHVAGETSTVGSQTPSTALSGTPSWSCLIVNMKVNPSGIIGLNMQRKAAYGQQHQS